jgi:phage tail-like protein
MALSTDDIKSRYPLPSYNYKVEIAGESIAFSQVSGLSLSFETTTYKESQTASGLVGPAIMHMPAQIGDVTVTLQKGVVRGGVSLVPLYNWINQTQINQIEKKDIFIRLMDENGAPVISWQVINAFPTSLEAPTFDSNSNDAAIESMQLKADRIRIEES